MTARWRASAAALLALLLPSSAALAQEAPKEQPPATAKPAPEKPATDKAAPKVPVQSPVAKKKPAEEKKAVSIEMSVTATSPDPPWLLRIENTSDVPVRIPADSRLLHFDLKASKGGTKKCAPPKGLVPKDFDQKRELFLKPGEVYEEEIDPRMYCFGDTTDFLRPGTKLTPHFGFGKSWGAPKEPFVAQSTDDLAPNTPLKSVSGLEFTLPPVPSPPPAPGAAPGAPGTNGPKPVGEMGSGIDTPGAKPAPGPAPKPAPAPTSAGGTAPAGSPQTPAPGPEGDAPTDGQPAQPAIVDKNAGHLDVFVSRLIDASAPRDIVLTVRAKNEGKRKLAAVLRGRMLHFHVEEVGADNRTLRNVDCTHQNAGHGIATEMISQVGPGKEVSIPLSISEICPRGTFPKPGLYRITPKLDTAQEGEVLKHDPWLGQALARQSALVRLATAKDGYYYASPRSGPKNLPPNTLMVAGEQLPTPGTRPEQQAPAEPKKPPPKKPAPEPVQLPPPGGEPT
ncbi:MAG: hypothetical protein HOW73_02655 [Polyangiaceae bacterium]|nr:hypothetical protein [Polyangiaceae bacterium]